MQQYPELYEVTFMNPFMNHIEEEYYVQYRKLTVYVFMCECVFKSIKNFHLFDINLNTKPRLSEMILTTCVHFKEVVVVSIKKYEPEIK